MADDLPQGGIPPEHEMDPEAEPLPLCVRRPTGPRFT
ncbi:hypothetical protein CsSME_00049500 [Camellia sinensis var. sinensis]